MGWMKYINGNYARSLLGNKFPLELKRVVATLDQFLNFLNDNGDPLPMQLLMHNLSKQRKRELSEFAKVDADIVLQHDPLTGRLTADLRDYRIHREFARPEAEHRVVLHILITDAWKTTWAVHLPLQSLMLGFGDPRDGFQCYAHGISFMNTDGHPTQEELFYCGITSRSWLTRMNEHFRDIKNNSKKLFHKRWREYQDDQHVLLNSELVALNHTKDGAMGWEEWIVDRCMEADKSLNMIPGGRKGWGNRVKTRVD